MVLAAINQLASVDKISLSCSNLGPMIYHLQVPEVSFQGFICDSDSVLGPLDVSDSAHCFTLFLRLYSLR